MAAVNLVPTLGLWPVLLTMNEAVNVCAYNGYGPEMARNPELSPRGVFAAGRQVTNMFAFDSAGRPLTKVRLYDQNGRPVNIGVDAEAREAMIDATGRPVGNAYPYRYSDVQDGGVDPAAAGSPPVVIPPLLGVPAETSAPTASPSPTGGKR